MMTAKKALLESQKTDPVFTLLDDIEEYIKCGCEDGLTKTMYAFGSVVPSDIRSKVIDILTKVYGYRVENEVSTTPHKMIVSISWGK